MKSLTNRPYLKKRLHNLRMSQGTPIKSYLDFTIIIAIIVLVDRLTKGAHFIALKPHFSTSTIANDFMKHVVKLHGFPRHIITDHDSFFSSAF